MTRREALEEALGSLVAGRDWIADNPRHELIARAREKVRRLEGYVETLVLLADDRSLEDPTFRALAAFALPCGACNGTTLRKLGDARRGKCFRCKGKGFQTANDARRNAMYDARRDM